MKIFILAILLSINFLNSEEINVKDFTIKYLEASRNQDWDYLKKILHEPTLFEFKKLLSNMLNDTTQFNRRYLQQKITYLKDLENKSGAQLFVEMASFISKDVPGAFQEVINEKYKYLGHVVDGFTYYSIFLIDGAHNPTILRFELENNDNLYMVPSHNFRKNMLNLISGYITKLNEAQLEQKLR